MVDYECTELIYNCIKSSYEGSLVRINDEVKYLNPNELYPKTAKSKLLCNIDCNRTNFYLKKSSAEEMTYSETPWLIIKDLEHKVNFT